MLCDFCSASNPVRSYACQSFTVDFFPISESVGNWAACQECAGLIDGDRWDELAERAVDSFIARYGRLESRALILKQMRELHAQFRKLRLQTQ